MNEKHHQLFMLVRNDFNLLLATAKLFNGHLHEMQPHPAPQGMQCTASSQPRDKPHFLSLQKQDPLFAGQSPGMRETTAEERREGGGAGGIK